MVAVTAVQRHYEQRSTGHRTIRLAVVLAKVLLASVVAFLFWHELAPTAIGGNDSYVVTDGTSMLPTIRAGSMVIIRPQPTYRVGEVAAYHNQQLRSVVLHRIVAINQGQFTFKGDNNPYADADVVTQADIVGAKWVYSPRLGQLSTNLRKPFVGAIVLALGGMWAAAEGPKGDKPRHRRRRTRAARNGST